MRRPRYGSSSTRPNGQPNVARISFNAEPDPVLDLPFKPGQFKDRPAPGASATANSAERVFASSSFAEDDLMLDPFACSCDGAQ